jgi:hypothetical protein
MDSIDKQHINQSLIVWAISFVVLLIGLYMRKPAMLMSVDKDGKEVVRRDKVTAYALLLSSMVTLVYFLIISRKKVEAASAVQPLSMRMFGRRKMRMGGCGCSK